MAVRTNYVYNPSYEASATTAWNFSGSRTATPAATRVSGGYVGTYAMELTYTAGAGDDGTKDLLLYPTMTDAVAAVGEQWTVSVYAKLGAGTNSGITGVLRLYQYDAASAGTGNQDSANFISGLTSEWQRLSQVFTLTGATTVKLRASHYYTSLANGDGIDILFDGWMLEKVATAGTYFDGSTTDTGSVTYDWTGTADNSPSTATDIASFTGLTVKHYVG